jgi:hypothetical protein
VTDKVATAPASFHRRRRPDRGRQDQPRPGAWRAASAASWCWSRRTKIHFWSASIATRARRRCRRSLFFLFQRTRQLEDIRQHDLFETVRVADYLLDKDRLFAQLTLDEEELALYEQVYRALAVDAPAPDLVIYLQAPVDVLLERIERRGIPLRAADRADVPGEAAGGVRTVLSTTITSAPLLIVNAAQAIREQRGRLQPAAGAGPAHPPRPPVLQPAEECSLIFCRPISVRSGLTHPESMYKHLQERYAPRRRSTSPPS